MQFRLVILGVALLVVGLLAYSSIPNVHRTPVLTTQSIVAEKNLVMIAGSSYTVQRNITVLQGKQNDLRVNITVTETQSGELATLRFLFFLRNNSTSCSTTQPTSFLVSQKVSNETIPVTMNSTGTYCFIFDNEDPTSKTASVFAFLDTRSEQVLVAKDGGANTAGLGLGAFGILVLLYGVTRKTVIPWE